MRRLAVVSVIAVMLMACNDSTGPSGSGLNGTWKGTATDSQTGSGTASVTLSQSGQSLSGTWQVTFQGVVSTGNATGAVNGANLVLTLEPSSQTDCTVNVTGTVSGSTISGDYSLSGCSSTDTGTLTLTKQ